MKTVISLSVGKVASGARAVLHLGAGEENRQTQAAF